jgi:hypothetical protein
MSHGTLSNRIASLTLGAALAFATGCTGTQHVSYVPTVGEAKAEAPSADVEVLLDRAPDAPHVVTGALFAKAFTNPQSIALMRQKAREAGLDGIYWVDCTSTCSGRCSAKGYVYLDRSFAKTAAHRQVASK